MSDDFTSGSVGIRPRRVDVHASDDSLLPGITVLATLVADVRAGEHERIHGLLAEAPTAEQLEGFERLLRVPKDVRTSELDQLRGGKVSISGRGFLAALERACAIQALGVGRVELTVVAAAFTGPLLSPVAAVWTDATVIDRTTLNACEDARVIDAIGATGRSKLVIAGLWTEACVAMPALSALEQGYEVYVATDACVGVTAEAYERAIERMIERRRHADQLDRVHASSSATGRAVRAKKPHLPVALVSSRTRPMGNAARS